MNVDNLKIIQLGITLSNEDGVFPEECSTWQFNFKFDLKNDIYLHESINLLGTSGIDFKKFNEDGIDVEYFAEHIISSGLVLNENIKWITFHGIYDFGYLLKAISNQQLPEDEHFFLDILNIYFPYYYDIRYMIKNFMWLKGSLSKISNDMDIKRVGQCHQAGSDSLVTSKLFFKLLQLYPDQIELANDENKLFGFTNVILEENDMPGSINSYLGFQNRSSNQSFNPMNMINFPNNKMNVVYQNPYINNINSFHSAIPNTHALANNNIIYNYSNTAYSPINNPLYDYSYLQQNYYPISYKK
jgi:CCR4-NOT transcription complex subunit 7/8